MRTKVSRNLKDRTLCNHLQCTPLDVEFNEVTKNVHIKGVSANAFPCYKPPYACFIFLFYRKLFCEGFLVASTEIYNNTDIFRKSIFDAYCNRINWLYLTKNVYQQNIQSLYSRSIVTDGFRREGGPPTKCQNT